MSKQEKGIFVTIRFWTDFRKEDGTLEIIPKQSWAAGSMYVRASNVHGIKAGNPIMFNNLEEFTVKLDQLLRQHDITLVIKMRKETISPDSVNLIRNGLGQVRRYFMSSIKG